VNKTARMIQRFSIWMNPCDIQLFQKQNQIQRER
jgi:hypothetical protein